ncbi:ClpP/crotonase [Testicularia cyperi]|uniref:ClpP/crotonase n=1 Tax=Testicularia cyperi TaxID=1882483 RepID=A0A317XR42_9BASI|nr:ClpP/crotonase [Testicularia cyperi]
MGKQAESLGSGKVRLTYHNVPSSRQQASQIMVCTIDRPERRNAVDGETAAALYEAFVRFGNDPSLSVAILTGAGGNFCAGADLKAIFDGFTANQASSSTSAGSTRPSGSNLLDTDMDAPGPMGVTRLVMNKPVIAAISGYAVAGGIELAAWCDLRVACAETAKLGVLCRLRGVPLIDGGTVRLPALVGLSRASDLILTGRLVDAKEAQSMGLINYSVHGGPDKVLQRAIEAATLLTQHPRTCMLNDRASMLSATLGLEQGDSNTVKTLSDPREPDFRLKGAMRQAMQEEFRLGLDSLAQLQTQGAVGDFVNKVHKSRL